MTMKITSSVVVAGGPFQSSAFDQRNLVQHFGELDGQDTVQIGPIGQFRYGNGSYEFSVQPQRLDLKAMGDEVLPGALLHGISVFRDSLISAKSVMKVTAVGLNCDTVFDTTEVGRTGRDFCQEELISPNAMDVIGTSEFHAAAGRFFFYVDSVRYDVRIEPELNSDARNLFVAVNAHQDMQSIDELDDKLVHFEAFREYVIALHSKLTKGGS